MNFSEVDFGKWLVMADFEYLSARLLMMHSLYPVALPTAARSLEMYLKIFLALKENKLPKDLKEFSHDLIALLKTTEIKADQKLFKLIEDLNQSYKNRYPDNWGKGSDIKWKSCLEDLDSMIYQIRNIIIKFVASKSWNKFQDVLYAAKQNNDMFDHKFVFGGLDFPSIFKRGNKFAGQFKNL